MNKHPRSVPMKNGMSYHFKTEAEEIAAYRAEPSLFVDRPDWLKDEAPVVAPIVAPVVSVAPIVPVVPADVMPKYSPVIEQKPQETAKRGRPAKRRW